MARRDLGAAGQLPADPVVHGPEREADPVDFDAGRSIIHSHLVAEKYGVEHEPGPLANERQVPASASSSQRGGRPPVLPHDGTVQRPARRRSQATAVSR